MTERGFTGVVGLQTALKLLMAIFALGLTSACVKMPGGPCTYANFEGVAEVIDIHENQSGDARKYRLRFTLMAPTGNKAVSKQLATILNGMEFDKEADPVLSGAKSGEEFYAQAQVITHGACTPVSFRIRSLTVATRASIYFAYDSLALTQQAKTTLNQYALAYRHRRKSGEAPRFILEGNTGQKGSREYNLMLGGRLADAARDYLLRQGVAGGDVDTVSFGEEQPRCISGIGEKCQAQNRRVDIIFR